MKQSVTDSVQMMIGAYDIEHRDDTDSSLIRQDFRVLNLKWILLYFTISSRQLAFYILCGSVATRLLCSEKY